MRQFSFEKTDFEGAFLINAFVSDDERGSFVKDYSSEIFKSNELNLELKEVFYTYSKKGVIRALHFQEVMQQAKLVHVIKGKIFDVIVDLRKESSTFGKWQGFYLSEESHQEIFIPRGFGHGYLVLEDSIVSYKCDEKFYAQYDTGIIWDDKDIQIGWPLELVDNIILSEKDKNLKTFSEYFMDK